MYCPPSPGPQANGQGGLHTQELPVTDGAAVWASPMAAGFFGPAWQTLGLVDPAPSIYALQGSLFCFSVPLSPSSLRRRFSRLPWVIIKHLPLPPPQGLGWKFLWQGNFSTKLCACSLLTSFLPPQNILPSLTHLLVPGPSLLVPHLLPSSESCIHRHRSGVEQR